MGVTLLLRILIFTIRIYISLQDCQEEISQKGITVKWHQSPPATHVESEPLCYINEELITRNCTESGWTPSANEMKPCLKAVQNSDSSFCPLGFYRISENNNDYCFEIGEPSSWNFPCFSSGGATIITDLEEEELESLYSSLIALNVSRYFWLPAQRQKLFNPLVWYIPGKNWGQQVLGDYKINMFISLFKNCLLLDIEKRVLSTETCTDVYPSLCFYINSIHYPAMCPIGYLAFRYKPDIGTCFGIEYADTENGLTFDEFLETKCNKPMNDTDNNITRFIFVKIAEFNQLGSDSWCWLKTSLANNRDRKNISYEGFINDVGTLGLINTSSKLPCMACETEVIYGETELMFEYNEVENRIYLTIYFPSGLWKYNLNEKGIQCFSDAKGFVKVIDINDLPYIEIVTEKQDKNVKYIEKIVYIIELVTDRSAQYWCEGHTFNFSLITTDKIIVNPKGNEVHVFALTVKYFISIEEFKDMPDMMNILGNLTELFNAKKVLLMDVYEYTSDHILILLHIHVDVRDIFGDEALNLQETYNTLVKIAEMKLPGYNATFISLKSSLYCLPITSEDSYTLDWELTQIGHISAPKQFCLQCNGLPVKRKCQGSYHNGGVWGDVEGRCDTNYAPSTTTEFLYNFVKKQVPGNYTLKFLTDGLNFVLSDIKIIIPADIYYLSMSLQRIIHIAQENYTIVEMGDLENMAWTMDRVMILDCQYLKLAQTLNSTNVILNSVNDIIEMIAHNVSDSDEPISEDKSYQLAVQPKFIVQISYPKLNNITGIAISKKSPNDTYLSDMKITPLYKNTTEEDILAIKNLEIASWIPEKVMDTLIFNSNESTIESRNDQDMHIIVSVFQNDAVFQEISTNNHVINSAIIGMSIPGYISNLQYPISILFRQLNSSNTNNFCGFWDFQSGRASQVPGLWKNQGCYLKRSVSNITVCKCYHLTHFSQLLTVSGHSSKDKNKYNEQHNKALDIITLTGCFLSLAGIIGIWITALVFSNWRKKPGTKVLLQLSTAISLPLVFIVIFNLDNSIFVLIEDKFTVAEHMRGVCIAMGALLHYSILASFMWMLITAILQFIRYVRVLGVSRPSRFMFKFTLIGWGIPLLPVTVVLILNVENYIPNPSLTRMICYPSGYYFIGSILVPICLILAVNIILFIMVLHAISRGPNEKMKTTDIDLVGAQLRLSVFLFFLLGLTWVFGIFSFSNNLVWSYLFCLTSTLQGFVLFIYFIICDPTTRNLWITVMKPQFSSSSSRNSITSFNSN